MKKLFAIVLLALSLGACAHMGDNAPVHPPSKTVLFDGIEFKVNSIEYRYIALQAVSRQVAPAGVFVTVDLSLKNTYSTSMPPQFQPRFALVDSKGAEHAPVKDLSQTRGENGLITDLPPRMPIAKRLVFDVPSGKYRLRVFMPVVVKTGLEGSALSGRMFYYDIGPLR